MPRGVDGTRGHHVSRIMHPAQDHTTPERPPEVIARPGIDPTPRASLAIENERLRYENARLGEDLQRNGLELAQLRAALAQIEDRYTDLERRYADLEFDRSDPANISAQDATEPGNAALRTTLARTEQRLETILRAAASFRAVLDAETSPTDAEPDYRIAEDGDGDRWGRRKIMTGAGQVRWGTPPVIPGARDMPYPAFLARLETRYGPKRPLHAFCAEADVSPDIFPYYKKRNVVTAGYVGVLMRLEALGAYVPQETVENAQHRRSGHANGHEMSPSLTGAALEEATARLLETPPPDHSAIAETINARHGLSIEPADIAALAREIRDQKRHEAAQRAQAQPEARAGATPMAYAVLTERALVWAGNARWGKSLMTAAGISYGHLYLWKKAGAVPARFVPALDAVLGTSETSVESAATPADLPPEAMAKFAEIMDRHPTPSAEEIADEISTACGVAVTPDIIAAWMHTHHDADDAACL